MRRAFTKGKDHDEGENELATLCVDDDGFGDVCGDGRVRFRRGGGIESWGGDQGRGGGEGFADAAIRTSVPDPTL